MKRVVVLSSLWAIVGVVVTCWMSWFVNFCASFRKPQPYNLNPGSTHTLMFLSHLLCLLPPILFRTRPENALPSTHLYLFLFFFLFFSVVVLTFFSYFSLFI